MRFNLARLVFLILLILNFHSTSMAAPGSEVGITSEAEAFNSLINNDAFFRIYQDAYRPATYSLEHLCWILGIMKSSDQHLNQLVQEHLKSASTSAAKPANPVTAPVAQPVIRSDQSIDFALIRKLASEALYFMGPSLFLTESDKSRVEPLLRDTEFAIVERTTRDGRKFSGINKLSGVALMAQRLNLRLGRPFSRVGLNCSDSFSPSQSTTTRR